MLPSVASVRVTGPATKKPVIGRPRLVAQMTLHRSEEDHSIETITCDSRGLAVYQPPAKFPYSLHDGYEEWKQNMERIGRKPPSMPIERLLSEVPEDTISNVRILTYRNNLLKIFSACYNVANPFEVDVNHVNFPSGTMAQGLIVLNVCDLDPRNLQTSRYSYWGRRFEETVGVDSHTEYLAVLRANYDGIRVLVAAETDAATVLPTELDQLPKLEDLLELKTNISLDGNEDVDWNFKRYKLLHVWLQTFLVGVPNIIWGFRDTKGRVLKTETMSTGDAARIGADHWKPFRCLHFGVEVLRMLVSKTKPGHRYKLKFESPFDEVKLVSVE